MTFMMRNVDQDMRENVTEPENRLVDFYGMEANMSLGVGLIMFLCIVPVLIICFVQVYPKNWQNRKLILGVRNREEFQAGETKETVEKIYEKYRRQALWIVIGGCVISMLLLLLQGKLSLVTTVWTIFVLVALAAINVPYLLGNREMKDLKRRLGLSSGTGVSYVDLNNAGTIRAIKGSQVILPNLLGLLAVFVAFLVDLKVLNLGGSWVQGSFLGTIIIATSWLIGILMTVLGVVLDRMRNDVISTNSDVNANYNRAKKKILADFFILALWGNTIFAGVELISLLFFYSELLVMIGLTVYMTLIFLGVVLFVLRERKIDERYYKEIEVVADDDDNWIFGMFYYNPKDNRLNVEKRVGVGGTINIAHPMGKILSVFLGLSLVATLFCCVWLGMMEGTPIKVSVEDGKVICHQLRDEYVIGTDEIVSTQYGEISGMHFVRVSGVGMDNLLKGNFTVDNQNGCRVFLNPEAGNYVRIETKEKIYYLSGATAEETKALYEELIKFVGN